MTTLNLSCTPRPNLSSASTNETFVGLFPCMLVIPLAWPPGLHLSHWHKQPPHLYCPLTNLVTSLTPTPPTAKHSRLTLASPVHHAFSPYTCTYPTVPASSHGYTPPTERKEKKASSWTLKGPRYTNAKGRRTP